MDRYITVFVLGHNSIDCNSVEWTVEKLNAIWGVGTVKAQKISGTSWQI